MLAIGCIYIYLFGRCKCFGTNPVTRETLPIFWQKQPYYFIVLCIKGQSSHSCPTSARCRTCTGSSSDSKAEFGSSPVNKLPLTYGVFTEINFLLHELRVKCWVLRYLGLLHYNLPARYGVFRKISYLLHQLRVRCCVLRYIGHLHYNLPVSYGVFRKTDYLLNKIQIKCCVLIYICILYYNLTLRYGIFTKISYLLHKLRVKCGVLKYIQAFYTTNYR